MKNCWVHFNDGTSKYLRIRSVSNVVVNGGSYVIDHTDGVDFIPLRNVKSIDVRMSS